MGFKNGAYAKVWEVVPPQEGKKTYRVRLSISRKDKLSGEYEQDFSGYVSFIGKAAVLAKEKLTKESRVKLLETDVASAYNKEKKEAAYYFKVFDAELADSGNTSPTIDTDYPFDLDAGVESAAEEPAEGGDKDPF
ncbi:MAG: hypothetical protein ACI4KR_13530 [Ruminiclostridium sp.]